MRKITLSCQQNQCAVGSNFIHQRVVRLGARDMESSRMYQGLAGPWPLLSQIRNQRRNLSCESKGFIHVTTLVPLTILPQMVSTTSRWDPESLPEAGSPLYLLWTVDGHIILTHLLEWPASHSELCYTDLWSLENNPCFALACWS